MVALPGAPRRGGLPRRFILRRLEDVHDFTGPGLVCWGVEWPDGTAAYRWNSDLATTVIAGSVADVVAIHGHDGKTVLEWTDPSPIEVKEQP